MVNNLTFIIGIILFLAGYYVGVVGIDLGDEPTYEVQGSTIYEVTYLHTYPWLGILAGVYGFIFTVVGLLQNTQKGDEITLLIKERINNFR